MSSADLAGLLRASLARGVSLRFHATGSSMSPFIRDDDVITISPLGAAEIGIGDVVAFTRPGTDRLVIHRIVRVESGSFLLQGDNVVEADALIPAGGLLGRLTGIERKGRACRLGLGPERRLIAVCNRCGLLPLLLALFRKVYRWFAPRSEE